WLVGWNNERNRATDESRRLDALDRVGGRIDDGVGGLRQLPARRASDHHTSLRNDRRFPWSVVPRKRETPFGPRDRGRHQYGTGGGSAQGRRCSSAREAGASLSIALAGISGACHKTMEPD